MKGLSIPAKFMQRYGAKDLNGIAWGPLFLEEQQYIDRLKSRVAEQRRKLRKFFNPFSLCPFYILISFPIVPSVALSVSFTGVNDIGISVRQAIEPTLSNVFIAAGIIDLRVPFPLYFLALFSSVGLIFNSSINALLQASKDDIVAKQEELLKKLEEKLNVLSSEEVNNAPGGETLRIKEDPLTYTPALDPFKLSPLSITVFVPIYETHTAIGIVFHDLNTMGISLLQSLEPSDNIFSIFRIAHLRAPSALVSLTLFLCFGLFICYAVNEFEKGSREDIINEIRNGIRELRKE